jgi:hypothetical protein
MTDYASEHPTTATPPESQVNTSVSIIIEIIEPRITGHSVLGRR